MSDLNRRALELMGWRVRYAESDEFGDWYDMIPPNSDLVIPVRAVDEDEAWRVALESGHLPRPADNPAAAIALLAGDRLEWSANTIARGERLWIAFLCRSAYVNPRIKKTARVEVVDGDEARAFAEAACRAWARWREAGE